jgi:hypothetical protein
VKAGDGVPVSNGEQAPECDERLERKRMKARMVFVASAAIRLSVHRAKLDGDGRNMAGNIGGEQML